MRGFKPALNDVREDIPHSPRTLAEHAFTVLQHNAVSILDDGSVMIEPEMRFMLTFSSAADHRRLTTTLLLVINESQCKIDEFQRHYNSQQCAMRDSPMPINEKDSLGPRARCAYTFLVREFEKLARLLIRCLRLKL